MADDGDSGTEAPEPAGSRDRQAPTVPLRAEIPTPAAASDDATGYVVWYRKHLRLEDHLALAEAVDDGDVVCPLFVFDPAFYTEGGLACDARIRFLHEAVASLDRLWAATPADATCRAARESRARLAGSSALDPRPLDRSGNADHHESRLREPETPGLTIGFGDPVELLSRFVDRGWSVLTMATPTSRYGARRDERVRSACGGAVEFCSGDGLVRNREWSRRNWQTDVEAWLTAAQHTPAWQDSEATIRIVDAGVTPRVVDEGFDISPEKTRVPAGTHRAATTQLREFVERIGAYPGNISAPEDAREGTSGLSPYLNFGLLSVRQAHQYVTEAAPSCRGREMFTDRLVWNMHYNQKLVDWPGWTERAVNPVFEGRNEERHDPDLVAAWKQGQTGFPMVDAAMRCLRETGWLNFRMRAMAASFFAHILQQPWWIGAEWYHHHLIDSDVGINYTQWQSQAGLVGKPSQRVYNPRKQVRDHDPEGSWITEWVPELAPLPARFLDRPERTPVAVQRDCGVVVGEDYPRPVVDFEARRESFWTRFERRRAEAARQLRRPEIAKRASLSGGYSAARAIAEEYGPETDADSDGTQLSLSEAASGGPASDSAGPPDNDEPVESGDERAIDDPDQTTVPTGTGQREGEPSPDDRAAVPDGLRNSGSDGHGDDTDADQASIQRFE